MESFFEIGVLGGGISSLACAKRLKKSFLLFDKNKSLGGLSRSVYIDDIVFDYTGHLLHLNRSTSPADLLEGVIDSDWHQVDRVTKCFQDGVFIDAPFQYNLHSLPENISKRYIDSYIERPQKSEISSLDEYFISHFGSEIATRFLIPYNEKLYGVKLDNLSTDGINRFFPKPDEKKIISSNEISDSYNSKFWYPKTGGIQKLVNSLSSNIVENSNYKMNEIISIDLYNSNFLVKTNDGSVFKFKKLASSLPLIVLCKILNLDSEEFNYLRQDFISKAAISSTFAFNLEFNISNVCEDILHSHWIYYADKNLVFHRSGNYSNFSEQNNSCSSVNLYFEVGADATSARSVNMLELFTRVVSDAKNYGLISGLPNRFHNSFMEYGYVRFLNGMTESRDKLISYLQSIGIYVFGRYGLWDYISMEDSIISGYDCADKINL